MKTVLTLLAAFITSTAAAPAIVWSGEGKAQVQTSELTGLRSLVETESASVVFIVERDEKGSEGLSQLTASGSLPKVASKYSDASSIHHSVRGIETFDRAAKDLGDVTTMTLEDFASVNNDGKLGKVAVVKISKESSASDIDSIVASAIEDSSINSVVLTSVRGLSEVRFERELKLKQEVISANQRISRRRMEDEQDEDLIYFVNFTPNIFAGLIFFFFFATVTYIGISCMGMIAGQEVYVTKYPTIGREA